MGLNKMAFLLSLDAGTTSVKAALFQPDGHCLASSLQEYSLISNSADEAELEPLKYWQATCQGIQNVLAQAHVDPTDVAGLSVSSQGETTIVMDEDGQPLRNALVWLDNRAIRQAESLKAQLGSEVYCHTGVTEVLPTWTASKVLWIKENEPEVFKRVHKILLVQDYLIYRLTGNYVTDGSISCTSLFYDIVSHQWWSRMLSAVGISADQLATLQKPGSIAGTLTSDAASVLGLSTTTRVVCGGMDQSVGAIGAGNVDLGMISETTGGALTIQACITDPLMDKSSQTPVYEHSVAGKYLFVPVCPTAGMAFKWFRDQFNEKEIERAELEGLDVYDLLNSLAEAVPAGSDGLIMLPHLMGAYSPESNPSARGVYCGFTLHHQRGHFIRALQEGVAFMLRRNLELIERSGVAVREVRSTGGGSHGMLWNQIKADVCNRPVVLLENKDTALVGDAILTGVACGVFKSIDEGVQAMVRVKKKVLPAENVEIYNAAYQRYCELDEMMSGYFKRNY